MLSVFDVGDVTPKIEANPLAMAVHTLVKVMSLDFSSQFARAVSSDDLTIFKKRLYMGFKGVAVESILDAYENLIDRSPDFMPSASKLYAEAKVVDSARKKAAAEVERVNAVAALPAPAVTHGDPVSLLATAKAKAAASSDSLADKLAAHNAMLAGHAGKYDRVRGNRLHGCAYAGCDKAGALSSGLSGGGNAYCANHYRMTV